MRTFEQNFLRMGYFVDHGCRFVENNEMIFILLPVVFFLHCLEEWKFGFPEWAVKHFGSITTRKFYLLSHILLMFVVLTVSLMADQESGTLVSRFGWVMVLTVIFTNGLFHMASTLIFREYSPGLVTSMFVTTPYAYFGYNQIVGEFNIFHLTSSVGLGILISTLIVYSLTFRRII